MSSAGELVGAITKQMRLEVSAAFGRLIQTKHLYQTETVDMSFIETDLGKVDQHTAAAVRAPVRPLRDGRWIPRQPDNPRVPPIGGIDALTTFLWFDTGTAKLFCQTCDRIEAFNPLLIEDLTAKSGYEAESTKTIQVFAFIFLCQSCKLVPEVFLVRRVNLKLTSSGRAPIEHVSVPSFIPKTQQRYFADAVVAFQSGQVLPSLFMLRTIIEQFVRERYGKPADTPEALTAAFDSYMSSLPEAFRSTFPSFPDLYAKLSIALHSADASSELFNAASAAIAKHFDARRLFELS
jgi:hypothetical protein